MQPVLWLPLVAGALWLAWIRTTESHLGAVRLVGAAIAGLAAAVAAIALVSDLARPDGVPSIAVMAGPIVVGALVGLVGIAAWHGRTALILRWVGFLFVLVAPMVFFGAGLFSVAAAFFYAPVLQAIPDV